MLRAASIAALTSVLLCATSAQAGDPDLTISTIAIDPAQPAIGHVVEITANIANIGDGSISDFLCIGGDVAIHFFLDGELIGEEQLSCGLDPGEVDPESVSVLVEDPGEHLIEVIVDPDDEYEESNESNNVGELTFTAGAPELEVSVNLPSIGAPGLKDMIASVTVTNQTDAKIKDIWVLLEVAGKTGPLDIGFEQGSNLSAGESVKFETEVDLGLEVTQGDWKPGSYTWRYQVAKNAMPGLPGSVPLTEPMTAPLELVPTVEVTEDNIVVPIVQPVAQSVGPQLSVTAFDVIWEGAAYTVTLAFAEPVDFFADSSWTILQNAAGLEILDDTGAPVCDLETRQGIAQAFLVWHDLIVEHPWYQGTYVALQESYDWYYDEKHLKVVFYITQPFVIVSELLQDMLSIGKELGQWVKEQAGLTTPEEAEVGSLTFKAAMVITKGLDSAGEATQTLVKLSPLFQGMPYLTDHEVSERLFEAIEGGGDDLAAAVDLIHEIIKEDSPADYEKISQVLSPKLILGAIASTLGDGVKKVLWSGIKHGFTAYFLGKLTARTAWKIAVGEGSATLMAGLTTAGIAKGIASFGLTLIIDASIAYLTYVGTFVDNIRGPDGLVEAGQAVAQSIPWTHVEYVLDGSAGPLDLDVVEDTFIAHAVMYEIYGFILSDLAMLKKLAFAKAQSQDYLDDSLAIFDVTKSQRTFAVSVQTVSKLLAAGECSPGITPTSSGTAEELRRPRHEPPPRSETEGEPGSDPGTEPAEDPLAPEWRKPGALADGEHPPALWIENQGPQRAAPPSGNTRVETVEDGCQSTPGGDRGAAGHLIVLLLGVGLMSLARREGPRGRRST